LWRPAAPACWVSTALNSAAPSLYRKTTPDIPRISEMDTWSTSPWKFRIRTIPGSTLPSK